MTTNRGPLTPVQVEVLALIAQGLEQNTIAKRLGVDVFTVRSHTGAIYGALGARNAAEAVWKACGQWLIDAYVGDLDDTKAVS